MSHMPSREELERIRDQARDSIERAEAALRNVGVYSSVMKDLAAELGMAMKADGEWGAAPGSPKWREHKQWLVRATLGDLTHDLGVYISYHLTKATTVELDGGSDLSRLLALLVYRLGAWPVDTPLESLAAVVRDPDAKVWIHRDSPLVQGVKTLLTQQGLPADRNMSHGHGRASVLITSHALNMVYCAAVAAVERQNQDGMDPSEPGEVEPETMADKLNWDTDVGTVEWTACMVWLVRATTPELLDLLRSHARDDRAFVSWDKFQGRKATAIFRMSNMGRILATTFYRLGLWPDDVPDAVFDTSICDPHARIGVEMGSPLTIALRQALVASGMNPDEVMLPCHGDPKSPGYIAITRPAFERVWKYLSAEHSKRAEQPVVGAQAPAVAGAKAPADNHYRWSTPFVASHKGSVVCCPGCGAQDRCAFDMMPPKGWAFRAGDRLLQCDGCEGGAEYNTWFAENHLYVADVSDPARGKLVFQRIGFSPEEHVELVGRVAADMEQRSRKMDNKKTIKEQGRDIGNAVGLGVAMAATNQSGEILVDMIKALFKNNVMVEAALEDELVRELAKASLALLLYSAAENAPGVMPKAEAISRISKLQVTWSTAKLSNEQLAKLRPMMMKLAEIGESLPAQLTEGTPDNEVEEAVAAPPVRERVRR